MRNQDGPIDLGALHFDDRLLDDPASCRDDDLAPLLDAWRRDVLGFSVSAAGVGAAALASVGRVGSRPAVRRISRRAAVASVGVAVAFASVGGVAAAAGSVGPDSPLWPITQVLHHAHAESIRARIDSRQMMARARDSERAGRHSEALRELDQATARSRQVRQAEGSADLTTALRSARISLDEAPDQSSGGDSRTLAAGSAGSSSTTSQPAGPTAVPGGGDTGTTGSARRPAGTDDQQANPGTGRSRPTADPTRPTESGSSGSVLAGGASRSSSGSASGSTGSATTGAARPDSGSAGSTWFTWSNGSPGSRGSAGSTGSDPTAGGSGSATGTGEAGSPAAPSWGRPLTGAPSPTPAPDPVVRTFAGSSGGSGRGSSGSGATTGLTTPDQQRQLPQPGNRSSTSISQSGPSAAQPESSPTGARRTARHVQPGTSR